MCEWPKYRTHWKESSIRPLEFPPLPNSISHAFLGKNDVRSSKLNFAATSNWARLMPPLRRPWQRSMRSRVSPRCSTSRREGKCPTRVSGKLKDKKYDRFIVVLQCRWAEDGSDCQLGADKIAKTVKGTRNNLIRQKSRDVISYMRHILKQD